MLIKLIVKSKEIDMDNIKTTKLENNEINKINEFEESELNVSSSPHMFADYSISKIMWTVILALLPAAIFGTIHFGLPALRTVLISVLSAVVFEEIVLKIRRKRSMVKDGSAVLTGLLLSMCLPPNIPAFMTIVGSFIAIVIAKHSMGGLGYNIFNPAHIGRAALMVSWPVAMTTWTKMPSNVDTITSATPLNILKNQGHEKLIEVFGSQSHMYKLLFLGLRNGSIGETSVLLLLLGGIFLIYKGYIDWIVPLSMILTVGILTWIFGKEGFFSGDPLLHVMSGGLIIGAFFMATDMVTTPITRKGRLIFAVGTGILTVIIRLLGGYPEGVCYSILLMNSITPLIDKIIPPVQFGKKRNRKGEVLNAT